MNPQKIVRLDLVSALLAAFAAGGALAQPLPNGSFESGLTGWTPGIQQRVESLDAAAFTGNPPVVPDGSFVALLSTGPGNVGGAAFNIDNNGVNEDDVTTLGTTLVFDFAPAVLRFEWAFPTSEQNEAFNFDDIFGLFLNNQLVFSGSTNKPGGASPFPDAPSSVLPQVVINSTGPTNGSVFQNGMAPISSACIDIPGAVNGANNIPALFFVADQGDNGFDSGLIIDDVRLDRSCAPSGTPALQQLTITATKMPVEVKDGTLVERFIANRRPASSSTGNVVVFASNGNLTGDNPLFSEQVYAFTAGAFTRLTAFTNSNPDNIVEDLDLARGGRWIAVAARATDGDNLEIFRIDRNNGAILQITNTTGCDNTKPSINGNGLRIAFLSTCAAFLTNGGSNSKMVLWNNGAFINNTGAPDCMDYDPEVSGANNGNFVAFASTCNHGNLNAAGEMRVFRFSRTGGGSFVPVDNPGPALSDVVDINTDGSLVAYIAEDSFGNVSAFRRDMNQSTAVLVGQSDPLSLVSQVRILDENNGNDLVLERLDLVMPSANQIVHVDMVSQISTPLVADVPGLDGFTVARGGSGPLIYFTAAIDPFGQNTGPNDNNVELFEGRVN